MGFGVQGIGFMVWGWGCEVQFRVLLFGLGIRGTEFPYIVQETGFKTIPKKNKCKKVKWLSEEAYKRRAIKEEKRKAKRKGKIYPFECRVPKNSKER